MRLRLTKINKPSAISAAAHSVLLGPRKERPLDCEELERGGSKFAWGKSVGMHVLNLAFPVNRQCAEGVSFFGGV